MAKGTRTTQLAIIGAGPGGYAAAFRAADLGIQVTLIDLDPNPGGTCLYRGCIPSKALLHVAKVLNEAREASHWGITFGEPQIELEKLRSSTGEVVRKMTSGLGQLCKARKIEFIQGRAQFESPTRLFIQREDGKEEHLECEYVIIATGSKPTVLPGLVSERVMDSTTALELQDIPKTLLVIGGGYIGLELGSVYAALGSKVTVVEVTPSLLPGADSDLVKPLAKHIDGQFHAILTNTRVVKMEEKSGGIRVTMDGADAPKKSQTFERVLTSVGRTPDASRVGIEHAKAEVDEKGFVVIDGQRRTSTPNVFAIGDVAGQPMLAHKATHEGRVAAETIAGHRVAFEPMAIPAVVYTDPEVAWCGLMEAEAVRAGRQVKTARFPWSASGRATTLNRNEGLTKIVADAATGEVIGVGIVGVGAGELIAEGTLAIEMGALASDLQYTIHAHPSLGETVMEAAELIFGQGTHVYRQKKK